MATPKIFYEENRGRNLFPLDHTLKKVALICMENIYIYIHCNRYPPFCKSQFSSATFVSTAKDKKEKKSIV